MSDSWRYRLGSLSLTLVGLTLVGFGLLLIFVFWISASLTIGTPGPTLSARRFLPVGVVCVIAGMATLLRLAGAAWMVPAAYIIIATSVSPEINNSLNSRYDKSAGWYLLFLAVAAVLPIVVLVLNGRFTRRPPWRLHAALVAGGILALSVLQLWTPSRARLGGLLQTRAERAMVA